MRSITLLAAIVLAVFLSWACTANGDSKASTAVTPSVTMDDYQAALAAAKAAQEKAVSVDGEWRDVEKLIKKAELAAEKGDIGTAVKLAEQARFESEMSYRQALAQKDAGPRF